MDGEWKFIYMADELLFWGPQKSRQSTYENEEDLSVKYNNNSGKSITDSLI